MLFNDYIPNNSIVIEDEIEKILKKLECKRHIIIMMSIMNHKYYKYIENI